MKTLNTIFSVALLSFFSAFAAGGTDIVSGQVSTTNSTQTTAKTWQVPDNSVALLDVNILALSDGDVLGSWTLKASVKRVDGGDAIIVGGLLDDQTWKEFGSLLWSATLDDSSSHIRALVTGANSTNITWRAKIVADFLTP